MVQVVVVATNTALGRDYDLALPDEQNNLVRIVAQANPRTVVVARCPGPCNTPWSGLTAALLLQLMGECQPHGNCLLHPSISSRTAF